MTQLSVDLPELVRSVVAAHKSERGSLLPILHALQDRLGYIDPEVVPLVASALNLSRADVHGVVSCYGDFRSEPAGGTTVRLCAAEACRSVGAERLVADAEQVFGVKVGQTTPDGSVSLDQVFCLGNCALGPAAQRYAASATATRCNWPAGSAKRACARCSPTGCRSASSSTPPSTTRSPGRTWSPPRTPTGRPTARNTRSPRSRWPSGGHPTSARTRPHRRSDGHAHKARDADGE